MATGHGSSSLRSKVVELHSGDAGEDT
jgi:hypothetical protein